MGIWTTDGDNDTDYDSRNGTSYSTPIVSGIVALLRAYDSSLIDRDFERIIELSADTVDFDRYPYGPDKWNNHLGHGRVNAHKALQLVNSNDAYHWTATGGTVTSSIYAGWWMYDLPGAPNGYYVGHRREVRKTVTFPQVFSVTPTVWGRINGTVGYNYSHANTCYSIPWCDVVPGTVTNTGATLRTYVYEISQSGGGYYGWYPTTPANVVFAYTAFGYYVSPSVYITGPSFLLWKEWGTWTANPSGGDGSYTYEWSFRNVGDPDWLVVGTNSTYTRQMPPNDIELQVKVTSNGQDAYDTHYVTLGPINPKAAGSGLTEQTVIVPKDFSLSQNFPNPFNPETAIRFGLPKDEHVQLLIIDLVGREVRRLTDGILKVGFHSVLWDGKDNDGREVSSGVYLYQIVAGDFRAQKKLALVR